MCRAKYFIVQETERDHEMDYSAITTNVVNLASGVSLEVKKNVGLLSTNHVRYHRQALSHLGSANVARSVPFGLNLPGYSSSSSVTICSCRVLWAPCDTLRPVATELLALLLKPSRKKPSLEPLPVELKCT
jgi:hypothetical protein